MHNTFNKKLLIVPLALLIILFSFSLGLFGFFFVSALSQDGDVYHTTDLNDYGNYIGTYDNDTLQKNISKYFPQKIEENFKNAKYSYTAVKGDSISCEAYLEFTIEHPEEFNLYISQISADKTTHVFEHDPSFSEIVLRDEMNLTPNKKGIDRASIQKILYNSEDRTVIFVFIMVHDGGFTRTDAYSAYASRFHIDFASHYA